jgi:hypothetical protein
VARRKLKIDPDFDFLLAGLATPLQDYRLAWWVNKVLHKELSRVDDLVVTDPESRQQTSFARFDYPEELTRTVFHLLQNRQGSAYLMPELKEMDYLLMIKGSYYRTKQASILKKLRGIEQMQAAVFIIPATLRSRNHLVIETDISGW